MKTSHACAALAWLAVALSAALPARASCQLSKLEIPVRIVNQRPVGTLNLNGTEVPLLIDSGAFYSMLTPAAAAQLNLRVRDLPERVRIEGYTGSVEAKLTRVEKVIFQRTEMSNVEFIVGGNEMGSGIQGILGRNFLSVGDTEYDLAHGVVYLMFPKGDCGQTMLAYWAGDAPVIEAALEPGAHDWDTTIRVLARINDRDVRAVLDTGAPRTSVQLNAARRAGLNGVALVEAGRSGGVGSERVRSWTGQIDSFELGGERISNIQLAVDDTYFPGSDMLLGLEYFLSHRIYVSRLQRKLYATWNGGPVFATIGVGQYNAVYAARPADISPGDAEALARRAEASAARGDLEQALVDLDRALELAPGSAAHLFSRARVRLAMQQFVKARQDLDDALRLQPGLHEALAIRAAMRVAGNEQGGALLDLFLLDTALPPSSHLRERMADLYAQLGQARDALHQWELWLPTHRTDAHLAKVLDSRCRLRTRLGIELELALKDCEEAVERDRGEPAYRGSLGWVHLRLNDAGNATKAFDDAIDRKSIPSALYGRALAYQRLSNDYAAERDLRAARRLQPGIDAEVRQEGLPFIEDEPKPAVPAPDRMPALATGRAVDTPRPILFGIDARVRQAAVPVVEDEPGPAERAFGRPCSDSKAPPTLLGPQSYVVGGSRGAPPCQPGSTTRIGTDQQLGRYQLGR